MVHGSALIAQTVATFRPVPVRTTDGNFAAVLLTADRQFHISADKKIPVLTICCERLKFFPSERAATVGNVI